MPDYHIYLHTDTVDKESPTKPKARTNKPTITKTTKEKESSLLKNAVGVGVGFLVSKATVSVVSSAINTGVSIYTSMTGDFRLETNWNNFKATVNVVKSLANPVKAVGLVINSIQNQIANQKALYKAQEQAKLTGDSIINYYTNLGV